VIPREWDIMLGCIHLVLWLSSVQGGNVKECEGILRNDSRFSSFHPRLRSLLE